VLLNPVTGTDPLKDDVSRVRGELGAGAGDFLIGAVGRVVGFKGQRELLIAMAPLLRAHPDIKLAIVGDAADGDAGYLAGLRDWVRDNALESQVCFAGFRSDIDTVYAALDVMAHTSVHPEPFGRVIVEAMLQGCAVVASAYGGPLEIIQDGIDGVLLDPRDAPALTEGIRLLYLDRERTRRIAEAGKAMARERFGEAAYARATVSLYRQLLGRT
jgi:glycosyltransferase involved in cell wall biosynthesis